MAWTDPSLTNVPIKAIHITELRDRYDNLENDVSLLNNRPWDVIIEDQKPQGCPGGHATSGSWLTRDLNTLVYNYNSLASLNNNIFTLPAGTYCIDWSAPACEVDRHKTRLYNHTTSEMIAYGTAEYTQAGHRISNRSHGIAIVTISTTTSFTIQHMCSTSRIHVGLGEQTGTGIEIYTRVCIKKIA